MPPNGRVYITPNTAVGFFYIDQFRNPWRLASAMLKSRHQLTILKSSSREEPPELEPDTSELLQTVVQIPRRDYVPWGPVRKRICVPLGRTSQRPGRTLTFSMLLCIYRYIDYIRYLHPNCTCVRNFRWVHHRYAVLRIVARFATDKF